MLRGTVSIMLRGIAGHASTLLSNNTSTLLSNNTSTLLSKQARNDIKQAIWETILHRISPEEKSWIDKIEQIRKHFSINSTQVSVIDYGAGAPDSSRSEEEMLKGTTSISKYSDICKGSKPELWALLLFKLVRKIQPEFAVELGTCIGISAAYQSAAQHLNGKGRLITIEGSESIANIAQNNLESLNLNNIEIICGKFKNVLPEIFAKTSGIDYVFIDGHHDEKATIEYFELFLPHLSSGALLIFDDISWSKGMKRAWKIIRNNSAVSFSADLKMIGICKIN